jgi:outer membrane murein-binding lipoprotein Lpp
MLERQETNAVVERAIATLNTRVDRLEHELDAVHSRMGNTGTSL